MSKELSFSSMLDSYEQIEKKVLQLTRDNPAAMLAVAAGVGVAFGAFGIARVVQLGIALNLQDRFSLEDLGSKIRDADFTSNVVKEA